MQLSSGISAQRCWLYSTQITFKLWLFRGNLRWILNESYHLLWSNERKVSSQRWLGFVGWARGLSHGLRPPAPLDPVPACLPLEASWSPGHCRHLRVSASQKRWCWGGRAGTCLSRQGGGPWDFHESSPTKVQRCLFRAGANFLPSHVWQTPASLTGGCSGGTPGSEGLVSF